MKRVTLMEACCLAVFPAMLVFSVYLPGSRFHGWVDGVLGTVSALPVLMKLIVERRGK